MAKYTSASEAVQLIKSGQRLMIHTAMAAPQHLIEALMARSTELQDVEIVQLHTDGEAPYVDPSCQDHFRLHSFFVGANVRSATQAGRADYIPVFLSEVPRLIREKIVPIDVALISVSPPDQHGWVTLGGSVDATLAAVEMADLVIAQVNQYMPRAWGDGVLSQDQIDYMVEFNQELPEIRPAGLTDRDQKIGYHIAGLIEDGATLQMGIGGIPNGVLSHLHQHKNLGVHTEMFSDGLIPLLEQGVVTNSEKTVDRHFTVSSFTMGSKKVFDFIHDNPKVLMKDVSYVNDVATIRQNPKVTAINSAIEIDLTGQVCADSIGTRQYSGVGGQIDFMRGASYSKGGKPIIAIPSVTHRGLSKIVPVLKPGAGVVTTRANVHYVVTEYGVAYLYGRSLKQRARALINVAHPDHREDLSKAAYDRWSGYF
ncbi:MAG: acetyl-CoA hydrolase/transferase family protein [Candidatus Cyclobacteriaceae bacterium M3_2C_046]